MAPNPEERTTTSVDREVEKQAAPEEDAPVSNNTSVQHNEGGKRQSCEDGSQDVQEHSDKSYMTAISGPNPSSQSGGSGMSLQHTLGMSPYNIGQAEGGAFVSSSIAPPGSIAQNSAYSAAQNSAYSSAQGSAGGRGHVIGEADFSVGMSMGSNATVSHQLGISQMGSAGPYGTGPMGFSQMGSAGPYGTGAMSASFGGSSGQFSGGYPGTSNNMAMPGEIMGTVTIPIYNTSPFPVPCSNSSQAGQQQFGNQGSGAAVGETEWHRSDGGNHNTHHMREGSSANNFGNVALTHTNRQPLSEENALAMQRQDDSLLAAQMSHAHLSEDHGRRSFDVARTDSKRGVRGAMPPQFPSAAKAAGPQPQH